MKPILYGLREREKTKGRMKKNMLRLCTRKRSGESQNIRSYVIVSTSISKIIARRLWTRREKQV